MWHDGDGRRRDEGFSKPKRNIDRAPICIEEFPHYINETNKKKAAEVVRLVLYENMNLVVAIGMVFQIKKLSDMAGVTGLSRDQAKEFENCITKLLSKTALSEIEKIFYEMKEKDQYDIVESAGRIQKYSEYTSWEFWKDHCFALLQKYDQEYGRKQTSILISTLMKSGAIGVYYDKESNLCFK